MNRPKIGIRPVIDGRWGGIREGLEAQTMQMAEDAKKLIEENVFYADGAKAEVVISPCTIGGGKEAFDCEEYFVKENVTATLTVTPCWCYGTETMDLNPLTTKAVWGFNGTERPGAVYLAASMAAFILSCGTPGKRYVTPLAEVMIHQPLGGAQGQATEIEIAAEHILKTKKRLNTILSENTGQPYETIAKDTDRDNWLSAQEAVAYGLIDKVVEKRQ